jgi:hypothetical protein
MFGLFLSITIVLSRPAENPEDLVAVESTVDLVTSEPCTDDCNPAEPAEVDGQEENDNAAQNENESQGNENDTTDENVNETAEESASDNQGENDYEYEAENESEGNENNATDENVNETGESVDESELESVNETEDTTEIDSAANVEPKGSDESGHVLSDEDSKDEEPCKDCEYAAHDSGKFGYSGGYEPSGVPVFRHEPRVYYTSSIKIINGFPIRCSQITELHTNRLVKSVCHVIG